MKGTICALHGNLGEPGDWNEFRAALPEWDMDAPSLWSRPIQPFPSWAEEFDSTASGTVLLGYSLGGRLAMHALLRRPIRWRAVIFVSAHPGLAQVEDRRDRLASDGVWADLLEAERLEEFRAKWNTQQTLAGDPVPGTQEHLIERNRQAIAAAFRQWSLGVQADLRSALAACPVPQLWVAGSEDAKFRSVMSEAAARIPSATYTEIAGCGHRVPLRNPTALAECVRRFLAELNSNP
jgi:2-succinyl-6-hydroxy-2,4-cyclohexadiene-1-carboxylate synthase